MISKSAIDEFQAKSTICPYGTGMQDMAACKMIYVHWPGYYPTTESFKFALENLCPNSPKLGKS